jgi:hypothetical protein
MMLTDEDYVLQRGQAAQGELDSKDSAFDDGTTPWKLTPGATPTPTGENADLSTGLSETLLRELTQACSLRTVFGAVFSHRVTIIQRLALARERENLRAADRVCLITPNVLFPHRTCCRVLVSVSSQRLLLMVDLVHLRLWVSLGMLLSSI